MNTVKLHVPYDRVQEIKKDLRRWNIRHYPFRRQIGVMEVEIYPTPKNSFLLLKYS